MSLGWYPVSEKAPELCLAGNPGVADYYEDFMVTLWQEGGEHYPVWCLSHAGHAPLPSTAPRPSEFQLVFASTQAKLSYHYCQGSCYIAYKTKGWLARHLQVTWV